MIAASAVLIAVAAVLLGTGLVRGTEVWYYGSIMASALAALALLVGVRARAAASIRDDREDSGTVRISQRVRAEAGRNSPAELVDEAGSTTPAPVAMTGADPLTPSGRVLIEADDGALVPVLRRPELAEDPVGPLAAVPTDEPPEQPLTGAEVARIGRLSTPVVVVDGRPRYHLVGCLHLLGRTGEELPAAEAVGFGFTPCAQCQPATALLASIPRR
ncbi:MAG TPA: hypothetical protein VF163_09405 [Micromonosporaceae bacterium]